MKEREEESQRVSIGVDCLWARSPVLDEVFAEKGLNKSR
jgi:hypothetical protein